MNRGGTCLPFPLLATVNFPARALAGARACFHET